MANAVYYIPKSETLRRLVEDAKTAWHHTGKVDADRIHRAVELVEAGAVTVGADEVVTVLSNGTHYRMAQHTCKDTENGAIDGRCKHRWAKTLYRALQAQPAAEPRSIEFVASVGDVCGIATVWEDGRVKFAPYASPDEPWSLSHREIVYSLVLGLEKTEADARRTVSKAKIAVMCGK